MAGKAKFRIEGEDATAAAWKSAVGQANESAEKMKAAFEAAFAGISVAAIAELGMHAIEIGDQLSKAATKAGLGGKAFSELAYAAKIADVDVEALSTSIKKMQVNLSEASSGAKQPNEDLRALGLTLKELQALKADQQFELIGDRISQLKDPADRARAAVDLFGKAGADLLPLFEQGAAGIEKARVEAEKLGYSFNDEQLKRLADADEGTKKLKASWEAFTVMLTSETAPTLTKILNSMAEGHALRDFAIAVTFPVAPSKTPFEKLQQNLHPELGGRGRPAVAPGYLAGADSDTAKKAAAAAAKVDEQQYNDHMRMVSELNREIGTIADKSLEDDKKREAKRLDMADEWQERWKESEKELAAWRQEQADKQTQKVVDFWNGAFDAMEQNGKLSFKRLVTYMGAELLQIAGSKIIQNLFSSSSSNSAGAGILSGVGSAIAGLFGGTRDSGGRGEPGSVYAITPKARTELFVPDSAGRFYPNAKLSGGRNITIAPTYHINNPNDTAGLPRILRENNRQLIDDLERRGLLHKQ